MLAVTRQGKGRFNIITYVTCQDEMKVPIFGLTSKEDGKLLAIEIESHPITTTENLMIRTRAKT